MLLQIVLRHLFAALCIKSQLMLLFLYSFFAM